MRPRPRPGQIVLKRHETLTTVCLGGAVGDEDGKAEKPPADFRGWVRADLESFIFRVAIAEDAVKALAAGATGIDTRAVVFKNQFQRPAEAGGCTQCGRRAREARGKTAE